MNFFIKLSLAENNHTPISTVISPKIDLESFNKLNLINQNESDDLIKYNISFGDAFFLGDPVFHKVELINLINCFEKYDIGKVIRNVDGFYFLIIINKKNNKFITSSSLFNILPIYFADYNGMLYISSSLKLILNQMDPTNLYFDEQYYLEKALFNYPLFNRTPFQKITLLPSNSHLDYSKGKYKIKKHLNIAKYFVGSIKPWRKSLDDLSNLFIERAKVFLPNEKFMATLTGGFDSRTVIGLALHHQRKEFETYSYGLENDPDICIPKTISSELGFPHHSVILDETYARESYWKNARQFVIKSNGLGNLSRAHYHHAVKTTLKNYHYLVSGNFGSEIIRTMKIPGVMVSSLIFDMFEMKDLKLYMKTVESYPGIRYLNPDVIRNSLPSLMEEIKLYLSSQSKDLTINKMFYIYLFEEVFRKYFGPEIMIQRYFMNHRSPYLSFDFIEALLKTEIAGANGNFRETNPFKRYHGQVLYAHILKKTCPVLLQIPLDRGYKPYDFLTKLGPMNIVLGYLKKNYLKKRDKNLPIYSTKTNEINLEYFRDVHLDDSIFNNSFFKATITNGWERDQMNFINMTSAAIYHNWFINRDYID